MSRLRSDLSAEQLAQGTRDNLAGIIGERVLGVALFVMLPLLLAGTLLGTYFEVVAVLNILVLVGVLGLDIGLTRFTAVAHVDARMHDVRRLVGAAVALSAAWSVVLGVALWFTAPALARLLGQSQGVGALRIGCLAIPFLGAAYVLVAPSRGLKMMWPTVVAIQLVQPGVQLVATVVLAVGGLSLSETVWAYVASTASSLLIAGVLYLRLRLPARSGDPVEGRRRSLVGFSMPVAAMSLLDTLLLWVDTILIGFFRPERDVAVYGVVVRLLTIVAAVLFTVLQIFGPLAAQLTARQDAAGLRRTLQTATRWAAIVGTPLIAFLLVGGGDVLRLLRQPAGAGYAALVILALAFLIATVTGPTGLVITMSGRSMVSLANSAAALGANIGLNLLLIPRYGIIGAALAWSIVIVGINVARVVQVRVLFGIQPFNQSMLKPLAAAALATAAGGAVGLLAATSASVPDLARVGMVGSVVMAVFALTLWRAGLDKDDRMFFRVLVGRRPAGRPSASLP